MRLQHAADLLGVSVATVKNWLRTGAFSSLDDIGDMDPAVITVAVGSCEGSSCEGSPRKETKISSIAGGRLVSRANKTARSRTLMPSGYAPGRESRRRLEAILEEIRRSGIPRETALWACALRRSADLFGVETLELPGLGLPPAPRRLLMNWRADLRRRGLFDEEGVRAVFACPLPDGADPLGAVQLGSLGEGARVRGGIYFTPASIAESITGDFGRSSGNVMDPCCGTGQFLVHLARAGKRPGELWGIDLDPPTVRLACLNLSLVWPDYEGEFRIYCADFLAVRRDGEADHAGNRQGIPDSVNTGEPPLPADLSLVVTNPPWGYRFDVSAKKRYRAAYPELNSTESFSLVIARSIEFLRAGGVGVFILPESFLTVRAHRGIREWILKRCDIVKTEYLGRPFSGVFTPVIRVDLRKRQQDRVREHAIRVIGNGPEYRVPQRRLFRNAGSMFDLHLTPRDREIVDTLKNRPHVILEGNARWALGLVTGNNRKHLLTESIPGSEPVITGADISPYIVGAPTRHIVFRPQSYQQTADESLYRQPCKLVYRFIAREPVVALDYDGRITLNSANILIPELPGYTPQALAAVLNSSLYRFLYGKMFSALKILRSHLEVLPLPQADPTVVAQLDHDVGELIAGRGDQSRIDDLVFRICDISAADRAYIEKTLRSRG